MKNTSKLSPLETFTSRKYSHHLREAYSEHCSSKQNSLSAYDDKRYILGDGISTLPYGHYRTMNSSIFTDNTDSNQDDDEDNDDSERNVSETNSTSHQEDEDLVVWLKFFKEKK